MPTYNQRVKDGNNCHKPSLIIKIFDIQIYKSNDDIVKRKKRIFSERLTQEYMNKKLNCR